MWLLVLMCSIGRWCGSSGRITPARGVLPRLMFLFLYMPAPGASNMSRYSIRTFVLLFRVFYISLQLSFERYERITQL